MSQADADKTERRLALKRKFIIALITMHEDLPAPLILSFETVTPEGSLAVLAGQQIIAVRQGMITVPAAQTLLAQIKEVLTTVGLQLSQLNRLVTVSGPGSFTGLRVGIATVNALGGALNCPTDGIPTLECLTFWKGRTGRNLVLWAAGGRALEFYGQIWQREANETLSALSALEIMDAAAILRYCAANPDLNPVIRSLPANFLPKTEAEIRLVRLITTSGGKFYHNFVLKFTGLDADLDAAKGNLEINLAAVAGIIAARRGLGGAVGRREIEVIYGRGVNVGKTGSGK